MDRHRLGEGRSVRCHGAGRGHVARRSIPLTFGRFVVLSPGYMAGRLQCAVCAATVAVSLGVVRSGHAQLDYRLGAGTSVGASDNPRARPAGASSQGDGFASVHSNLQLKYIGSTATEQLAYGIVAMSWLQGGQGSTLNQRLTLSSDIQASPTVSIGLGGGVVLSRLSMTDTPAAVDAQTTLPRPAGDQRFLSVVAHAGSTWQIDGHWRLEQVLSGSLYRALGSDPIVIENRGLTLTMELGRQWSRDGGALQSRFGGISSSGAGQSGQGASPRAGSGVFAESLLVWRHDWFEGFAHEIGAGGMVLRTERTHPFPAGFAGATWRRSGSSVSFRASQTVDYSIFIGAAYQRRALTLRGSIPLDQFEDFALTGVATLERYSTVDAAPGSGGSADTFLGQVALSWRASRMVLLGLSYMFRDQRASSTTSDTTTTFSSLRRQTVLVTLEAHYPSDL